MFPQRLLDLSRLILEKGQDCVRQAGCLTRLIIFPCRNRWLRPLGVEDFSFDDSIWAPGLFYAVRAVGPAALNLIRRRAFRRLNHVLGKRSSRN